MKTYYYFIPYILIKYQIKGWNSCMFNKINSYFLLVIVLYLLGYYSQTFTIPTSSLLQSIGSSIFSILGLLVALYFLTVTLFKTKDEKQIV